MWNRRKSMLDSLADDIREHIERETQDNIDRGMPADEARFAAIRKFGNPTRVAEDTREVWTMTWLENFLQDARHGLRLLARNRAFAIAAIVTLAVGIGANTAIFSIVDPSQLPNGPSAQTTFQAHGSPAGERTTESRRPVPHRAGEWSKHCAWILF